MDIIPHATRPFSQGSSVPNVPKTILKQEKTSFPTINIGKATLTSSSSQTKSGNFSSIATLIKKYRHSRPVKAQNFASEVTFEHILLHVLKSQLLDTISTHKVCAVHPLFNHLVRSIAQAQNTMCTEVLQQDPNYATRTCIPSKKDSICEIWHSISIYTCLPSSDI